MAKSKTTNTTTASKTPSKSKLKAYKTGSHKAGDTIYTFKAGDDVEVKAEHLEIMKSLGAFTEQ